MGKAKYHPLESLSPYGKISRQRINNPKVDFKCGVAEIEEYLDERSRNSGQDFRNFKILDVGCGNGEFFHYFNNTFGHLSPKMTGVDLTEEFINRATELNILNAKFICSDIFSFPSSEENKFDIVYSSGTSQIFVDPTDFFNTLFSFLEPAGLLVCDGLFNQFDVDVHVQFKDNSKEESKNLWRCDFNQHSISKINQIVSQHSEKWEINPIEFTEDLEKIPGAPSVNNWTEVMNDGSKMIVNGLNMIVSKHLLVAYKK
jgi:ubiquinone/menaquinone biosynthesis C-methylase UbiE